MKLSSQARVPPPCRASLQACCPSCGFGRGTPSLWPGMSRGVGGELARGLAAASDSVGPLTLSVGVVLDQPGTPLKPIVCGNTFSSVSALQVRRLKVYHRKKLLACFSVPGQATRLPRKLTAVPSRDARVSLPAELGDTLLAYDVLGTDAKKFLSDRRTRCCCHLWKCSRRLTMLALPSMIWTHFCVIVVVCMFVFSVGFER